MVAVHSYQNKRGGVDSVPADMCGGAEVPILHMLEKSFQLHILKGAAQWQSTCLVYRRFHALSPQHHQLKVLRWELNHYQLEQTDSADEDNANRNTQYHRLYHIDIGLFDQLH